ncbi:MAG: DUF3160 domain-containing protein [Candidatus Bathyarchaeia archaeon]
MPQPDVSVPMVKLLRLILAVGLCAVLGGSYLAYQSLSPSRKPPFNAVVFPTVSGYGLFISEGEELQVVTASAPSYTLPLDLSKVRGLDNVKGWLSEEALAKLKTNGFVVVKARFTDLAEMYKGFKEAGIPVYVTTDSVFYVYHAFFDSILMDLEEEIFAALLNASVAAMVEKAQEIYDGMPEKSLAREAALLDMAYLSVAGRLLNPAFKVPQAAIGLVEAELELIEASSQTEARSPIFQYGEDYTQYKPRGHYTVSELLQRYFKAAMWLGRMRFEAQDPQEPELARLQTAQALILTYVTLEARTETYGSAFEAWEKAYLPTSFIVGRSDDLTLYDYIDAAKAIYGSGFKPESVNDEEKLEAFQAEVVRRDRARIVNVPWWPEEKPRMVGLRWFGQRFILDGYVHQELVYPKVESRTMVKGLDIAAGLGSKRAEQLLQAEKERFPGYGKQLDALKSYVGNLTVANWTESLYMGWLYSLKAEFEAPGEGYPAYMRTEAWLDKSLNTGLASWAQLRHDTILYAKQPYAAKVSLPPEQPHVGYVEPLPLVYSRLQMLVNSTRNGLEKLELLSDAHQSRLEALVELLGSLKEISVKELKGLALTENERALIAGFGLRLDSLLKGLKERVKDPRIIADVFTDPNSAQVLEVGTGYFHLIAVAYTLPDGTIYAGLGAALSYYEFPQPQDRRLTDEEWRGLLESAIAPARPEWTESFEAEPAR